MSRTAPWFRSPEVGTMGLHLKKKTPISSALFRRSRLPAPSAAGRFNKRWCSKGRRLRLPQPHRRWVRPVVNPDLHSDSEPNPDAHDDFHDAAARLRVAIRVVAAPWPDFTETTQALSQRLWIIWVKTRGRSSGGIVLLSSSLLGSFGLFCRRVTSFAALSDLASQYW